MSNSSPPPSLDELDAKLREAKARRAPGKSDGADRERGSGLSFAMRIGVELVAALIVGVGIGFLLDRWLGTKPWFLLLFFLLGAAAGLLNVFRLVSGYGYAAGYRKPDEGADRPPEGE